jgi:hypothetical protein
MTGVITMSMYAMKITVLPELLALYGTMVGFYFGSKTK